MRVRDLVIGEDDQQINKWASNHYIEHLLRKKDNAALSYAQYDAGSDRLYKEASKPRKYEAATNGGPKETGVKIRIGAPIEKDEPKQDQDDKGRDTDKKDEERKEEENEQIGYMEALF